MKIQGTVTKVVAGRGFYFITGDDAAQYFLHISEMERAGLNEPAIGDRFSFDVQVNNKGPRVAELLCPWLIARYGDPITLKVCTHKNAASRVRYR